MNGWHSIGFEALNEFTTTTNQWSASSLLKASVDNYIPTPITHSIALECMFRGLRTITTMLEFYFMSSPSVHPRAGNYIRRPPGINNRTGIYLW